MSILIPDIDQIIISLLDIPSMISISYVNKYYNKIIEQQPLYIQWKYINHNYFIFSFIYDDDNLFWSINYEPAHYYKRNFDDKFRIACSYGFLEYAKYLFYVESFTVTYYYASYSGLFRLCCNRGHINVAKWLVELSNDNKIDIDIEFYNSLDENIKRSPPHLAHWLKSLKAGR